MTAVVLATRNKGKIREISALLQDWGIEVRGLDQYPEIGEIPETGETFEENARIKAEAVSRATGLVALADDSGLAVDALSGAPGVYSARYAGEEATDVENNAWRTCRRQGAARGSSA
jgi:XTP/dITP diphosphohydrolase